MRIFHLADTHFSNVRLEQKVAAFEKCLTRIDELQRSDRHMDRVAVLAGDIFDHSLRMEDPGAKQAVRLISELNSRMPVLIIKGNQTHDRQSIELFDFVPAKNALITSVRPEVVELDSSGNLRKVQIEAASEEKRDDNSAQCTFVTLPYPSYSFVAQEESMPAESLRAAVSERITRVVSLFRVIDRPNKILVFHGTVIGAKLSESHRMMGMDIELSPFDIKDSDFDFVAGGHIHYAQRMEEAEVFYPGGLAYMTYADHGKRGMWVHETDSLQKSVWNHEFFDVEAPQMKTWEVDFREGHHIFLPDWSDEAIDLKVKVTFYES